MKVNNLYQKLLEVQKKIEPIKKTEANPFFHSMYFDVNGVIAALKPLLSEQGLILTQGIRTAEGRNILVTEVTNVDDGEDIQSSVFLPDVVDPQKFGSAVTYYRRYALQSLFALEAQDDDGNVAAQDVNNNPKRSEQFSPKKKSDELTYDNGIL